MFFQGREAANRYHDAVPGIVCQPFEELARPGRHYGLVDYHGDPQAERAVVIMGSGTMLWRKPSTSLVARGERVGVLTARLFRPFPVSAFLLLPFPRPRAASPCSIARRSQERSLSRCSRTS